MFRYAPEGLLKDKLRLRGPDGILVLTGATVIDGTGAAPMPNTTIVLRGDLIEKIVPSGATLDLPTDPAPETLDLAGAYVMPGMIDVHVHYYGVTSPDPMGRYISPYPSVRILRNVRDANKTLAAGFTTVRALGHGNPEHVQAMKEAINQGIVTGPRMHTSGWAISQTGGHGNLRAFPYELVEHLRPRSAFADSPDGLRKFVREILGDGADVIKIYTTEGVIYAPDKQSDLPNFTVEEIRAITDEAHRRGKKVAAHSTGLEGCKNAVLGGVDTLEHGPHETDDELLELMLKHGTTLVPTLSIFNYTASGTTHGYPEWVVAREKRRVATRRPAAKAAVDAGLNVAVGTDTAVPPRMGKNATELVEMVDSGITPMQAIVAATRNGARAMGLDHAIGTVEEGKRSDLLVLESNPLDDIRSLLDPENLRLIIQSRPGITPA